MTSHGLQDRRRLWLGAGAGVAALIVAVTWLFFVHPARSSVASLHAQATDAQSQNAALAAKTAQLARENAKFGTFQKRLAKALTALPPRNNLAVFTRQTVHSAANNSVSLESINAGDPVSVAAATPAPATPTDTDESTTSDTSTPAPAATTPAASGAFLVPLTVTTSGSPAAQSRFVHDLQRGARGVVVTSAQVTSGTSTGTRPTMIIQLSVFSSPVSSAQRSAYDRLLATGD